MTASTSSARPFRLVALALIALTLSAAHAAGDTPQPQPVPRAAATAAPAAVAGEQPIPPPPTLSAKNYVLMDYVSGQVLVSVNGDERVPPASITKVMTSYVVSQQLAAGKVKMDDAVAISENAWRGGGAGTDGSTSFLPLNSTVPLRDLLYGMIIQSGNDASIALAEHVAGSEEVFVRMMNDNAARLGLKDTHFANSHGLQADGHYSTAADIARLSRALIHDYPEEYKIYAIKDFTVNGIKQHNRNTLLWKDAAVDGIKTGHHSAAGYCLAASAQHGDTRLIAVVMGTTSEKIRAEEALSLLNYGFRFYESHKLYAAGALVAEPELWKGAAATAKLGVSADALVSVPAGSYNRLTATMNIPKPLLAPLSKGQNVGTLVVTLDGKPVLDAPLIALDDYPEGGFFKRLSDGVALWWSSK